MFEIDIISSRIKGEIACFAGTNMTQYFNKKTQKKSYKKNNDLETVEVPLRHPEQRALESKEGYRFLLDHSKEIILVLNEKGKIIFANKSTLTNFGYSEEELIGKTITSFLTRGSIRKALYALAQEFLGHPQPEFEVQAKAKSGETRYLSVAEGSAPIHENGKLMGVMVSASDITERKQAEEAVRRLSSAAELSPNSIVVLDLKGRIIDVNAISVEKYGTNDKSELVGKSSFEFIASEDRGRAFDEMAETLNKGKTENREYRIINKAGQTIPVEMSSALMRDKEGKPIGFVAVSRDITKRKRDEETLRESEAKFRTLTETAASAIFIYQGEKLVYVSPSGETLAGYSQEELLKMNFWELVPPEFRELAKQRGLARQHGERIVPRYEFKIIRKDGEERWVDFTAGVIQYGGKPAAIGTAFDITERKRTEQVQAATYRISDAAQAAKSLDELFGSIHAIVGELMPAKNFYIALYDHDREILSFPYFVDEYDEPPAPKRLGKGLTEYVLRTGEPLLASPEVFEELLKKGEVESIGTPSIDWLGVPLKTEDKTIGVLVVQSYTEGIRYREEDKNILKFVSSQAAMAVERKQAEEALVRLFIAAELSPDSIVVSDLEGRIIDVNKVTIEKIGAKDKSELIGKSSFELIVPEDRERAINGMAEVLTQGKSENRELSITKITGETIPVEMSVALMKDREGRPIGFVGISRDISERKKAEKALLQSMDQLRTTMKAAIKSLSSAIEMRDPYTVGHQERVTKLATAIAQEMGLLPEQIEGLQLAGIIHDIGKLNIPSEILNKPTTLTDIEYALIKTHAEAGFKLLNNIEFPWPVAEIVYQHHECMNGSGYPRGLTGKDILLEARILSVADTVEAMSFHRPYRPALGFEKALQEITLRRGTLYDAGVVDACVKLFAENRFQF